jgi:WD40 repeat protein
MNKNLSDIKQDGALALKKAKSLLDMTNRLLSKTKSDLASQDIDFRLHITMGHSGPVTSVAISPDGKYIVSGNYDNTIKLWDIESGKEIRNFEGHSSIVASVAISPDGKYIVSGSHDKTVKLWDIESGEEIKSFEGHSSYVSSVAISPDGKYIVSGSGDIFYSSESEKKKLWDIESGEEIGNFEGHSNYVSSVAISPDGKHIISGGKDNIIKLWDIKSGEEIAQFMSFEDNEWIFSTKEEYYNCSDGAHKYFGFFDRNRLIEKSHPIYKQRKRKTYLKAYYESNTKTT